MPKPIVQPPQPAKPVDLDRYVGSWREIGRYENWFERGCEGATAAYAKRPDGLIDVINSCRAKSLGGRVLTAKGRAKIVAGSQNAKLKVSFFGPFFWGDYWVLDHGDDYDWSIVGEPSRRYLWLLARAAHPGPAQVEDLLRRAEAFGYDRSRIRLTKQPVSS